MDSWYVCLIDLIFLFYVNPFSFLTVISQVIPILNFSSFVKARKALRALKGLVKIQALVRGFLVRKQAAATLQGMQALIRAQASVRAEKMRRLINNDDNFPPHYQARVPLVSFQSVKIDNFRE